MKIYTIKPDEDLGSIAHKFGMPSWKYLYQIIKDKIGDTPDLLKAGRDRSYNTAMGFDRGDEKIKANGVDPLKYTDGLPSAYPWGHRV